MKLILSKNISVIFFVSIISGNFQLVLCSYTAVILHEMSHLAVCSFFKVPCNAIYMGMCGMHLQLAKIPPPAKRIYIAVAGPATSFLLFALSYFLRHMGLPCIRSFEFANLCIGTVNLIPILPLDGGTVLKEIFVSRCGLICGGKLMTYITRVFLSILTALFLLSCIKGQLNPSLAVFTVFLIRASFFLKKNTLYEKNLVLSGRIRSLARPRYMALSADTPLIYVAEKISPSYYLIAAFFEDGRFAGELNQDEIIKICRQKGASQKFPRTQKHML